jgi:CRISPR/Cas system-associated endonuclease/helicase Cas3
MYYAHSPNEKKGVVAQTYEDHIKGVMERAAAAISDLCRYARLDSDLLREVLGASAELHDLGKLDGTNQKILSGEKKGKNLPIQHTDAGTAFFLDKNLICAMLIQAHHIGYGDLIKLRNEGLKFLRDKDVSGHVDKTLPELLNIHRLIINIPHIKSDIKMQGDKAIFFRLALSCLVDADHTDTATHYGDYEETRKIPDLKPSERLKRLDEYVASLKSKQDPKSALRNDIYNACKNASTGANINSCDSPVGSGKTTAVMAHLLKQAEKRGLRRIIVVLPTINIINQSVKTYRDALLLPGENAEDVVAEIHHKADFQSIENRHLTALWRSPIIVTTAVTFFETLASNTPSALRRLHELPGSAIFIDESHAALPAKLLPLAWRWIKIYSNEWSCYWVLASGSLNRFWELEEMNDQEKYEVPEIVPAEVREKAYQSEKKRIEYKYESKPMGEEELASWIIRFPGPRLVILNTVQSAAVLANYFNCNFGRNKVEHLSTALISDDRGNTLKAIKERLQDKIDVDWTFIATSCVEAGVDFSFRTGFREAGSLVSLLQAGGRVNREGLYPDAEIWTFKIKAEDRLREHPEFKNSAHILEKYFERGIPITPELSTKSIAEEIRLHNSSKSLDLLDYEKQCRFPLVEEFFKVIDTDTRLTVVDEDTIKKIENNEKLDWQIIQRKSVQIRKHKLDEYHIKEILPGIYGWTLDYNSFLGYMAGVLLIDKFSSLGGFII